MQVKSENAKILTKRIRFLAKLDRSTFENSAFKFEKDGSRFKISLLGKIPKLNFLNNFEVMIN